MKVFISWSGTLSHSIAIIIRDWLPNVIQSISPYVSSEDIDKGTRWANDIAGELSTSYYGILCVTKDNIDAPWLNFEAGALSKSIDTSRVSPFLFNVKRSDINGPILQFQSTIFEKEDFRKLIFSIKKADTDCKISDQRLEEIFEVWWPMLKEKLDAIRLVEEPKKSSGSQKQNATEALLEQILEATRNNARAIASQEKLIQRAFLATERPNTQSLHPRHPVFLDLRRSLILLEELSQASDDPAVLTTLSRAIPPIRFILGRSIRGTRYSDAPYTSSERTNLLSLLGSEDEVAPDGDQADNT